MKTNVLRSLLALCLLFGFQMVGKSQTCISQADLYNSQSLAIDYCATEPCAPVNVLLDMQCSNLVEPFLVEGLGGIVVENSVPEQISPGVFRIRITPIAGNVCKGRILFRYFTSSDSPCNDGVFPSENLRYIDVFKNLTNAAGELNDIYKFNPASDPIGPDFRILTETPSCITPDDFFNLTVYPIFSSCVADGIGLDEIYWVPPVGGNFVKITESADGSSITYQAPADNLLGSHNTFGVKVGRASLGQLPGSTLLAPQATVDIRRGVSAPYIVATGVPQGSDLPPGLFTNLVQGFDKQIASACMPINRGGEGVVADRFTLAALPSGNGGSSTFQWTVPGQFTLVEGSLTSQAITVEAKNRDSESQYGSSGVFYCRVTSSADACGNDVAFFTISRNLVENYNSITVSPAPGQGASVQNCFRPGEEYSFKLEKAPFNTPLIWSNTTPSTSESYWEVVSRPTAFEIVLSPVVVNNDLEIPLSVKGVRCSDAEIHYRVNSLEPQIAGTTLEFRINNADPFNIVYLEARDPNVPNSPWTVDWPALVGGGASCQSNDYQYDWSFTGGNIFNPGQSTASGIGLNSVLVNNAVFSGTMSVEVRSRNEPPAPGCPNSRCFYVALTKDYENTQFRAAVDPGQTGGGKGMVSSEKRLGLFPNPASQFVTLVPEGMSDGGVIRILNSLQQVVLKRVDFKGGNALSLKGMSPGIYTVEYVTPDGQRASSRLSIE